MKKKKNITQVCYWALEDPNLGFANLLRGVGVGRVWQTSLLLSTAHLQ